jgi:hypothetical protein
VIVLGLLLALAAPSRAQVAPAPSAPVDASNLDDVFKRFASGKPMLPTLKEVQAEQLKRDLAPRKTDEAAAPAVPGLADFRRPPMEGVRRDTIESVDVAVGRPVRRLELGVGVAEENAAVGTRAVFSDQRAYAFARFDLSKVPLPRKLLHSPTAIHAESVLEDGKAQVKKDEYTTRFLTHPAGN